MWWCAISESNHDDDVIRLGCCVKIIIAIYYFFNLCKTIVNSSSLICTTLIYTFITIFLTFLKNLKKFSTLSNVYFFLNRTRSLIFARVFFFVWKFRIRLRWMKTIVLSIAKKISSRKH